MTHLFCFLEGGGGAGGEGEMKTLLSYPNKRDLHSCKAITKVQSPKSEARMGFEPMTSANTSFCKCLNFQLSYEALGRGPIASSIYTWHVR